jgi:hypothetical protein
VRSRSFIVVLLLAAVAALGTHANECNSSHAATVARVDGRAAATAAVQVAALHAVTAKWQRLQTAPPEQGSPTVADSAALVCTIAKTQDAASARLFDSTNTALAHKAVVVLLT